MSSPAIQQNRLRRTLGLWDLILYGVIVIQPTAPMSVFGVLSDRGRGHVVTTILIAMVAMLFTAISYGRMARAYPSAGSAFTYVGQEINPALGYITGWSMVDGLHAQSHHLHHLGQPAGPRVRPGRAVLRAGRFFALAVHRPEHPGHPHLGAHQRRAGRRHGRGDRHLLRLRGPLHLRTPARRRARSSRGPSTIRRPSTPEAVLGGTSIAVLTYIGFDGISTLSEEAENPRRNILLATVLTCVVIGILSALEVYAAQLVWPASEPFPDVTTAFVYVAGRTWAPLFAIVGFTLVVANFGSGMGAQLGAARLLFGMGRSNALPKSFFGAVDPKQRIPRNNVLFVGVVSLAGAFIMITTWARRCSTSAP